MSSKSKIKGSSWEREICKFFEEIFGYSFIRTPGSGAYVGGTNNSRKTFLHEDVIRVMKGDICPPPELVKMNVEAKNYQDLAFHQLINGDCKKLDDWISQTEDAADEGDISFTIFKITRRGSWVALDQELCNNFKIESHLVYKNSVKTYIVTDFKSFFETNKDIIKNICS